MPTADQRTIDEAISWLEANITPLDPRTSSNESWRDLRIAVDVLEVLKETKRCAHVWFTVDYEEKYDHAGPTSRFYLAGLELAKSVLLPTSDL